jgi:hypothetical protein
MVGSVLGGLENGSDASCKIIFNNDLRANMAPALRCEVEGDLAISRCEHSLAL